jgi:hypothetical protein
MDQSFDPTIPGYLEGEVGPIVLSAPATFPPPALRRLVVDPGKPFEITVEWEIFGDLVPLWLSAVDKVWNVEVYAESVGPGPEITIGSATVGSDVTQPCTSNPGKSNCTKYSAKVVVAAGTLPEDDGASSGIYKLVATVFLNSSLSGQGYDLAGFTEGPIIRVEGPQ